jgi:hypothetical protein
MKKIITIIVASVLLSSCGDFEPVIFDPITGQTLAFFPNSSSDLEVLINESATISVSVSVNTLSSSDRTVSISVDSENTTATSGMYTFDSTVTIPANEFTGSFSVTGIDDGLTTSPVLLTLKLDSVADGVVSAGTFAISIFEFCPIAEGDFEGDYLLEQTNPAVGAFGVPMFPTGVVNIEATGLTSRTFSANYLGDLGIGQPDSDVPFSLICNETFVGEDIGTGLGCGGGGITLGPGTFSGSFNGADDSVFTLVLADFVTDGGCGVANPYDVTITFTKQ